MSHSLIDNEVVAALVSVTVAVVTVTVVVGICDFELEEEEELWLELLEDEEDGEVLELVVVLLVDCEL